MAGLLNNTSISPSESPGFPGLFYCIFFSIFDLTAPRNDAQSDYRNLAVSGATDMQPYGQVGASFICTNAQTGTFNHECGLPGQWIGGRPSRIQAGKTFRAVFCGHCKEHGHEARGMTEWQRITPEPVGHYGQVFNAKGRGVLVYVPTKEECEQ